MAAHLRQGDAIGGPPSNTAIPARRFAGWRFHPATSHTPMKALTTVLMLLLTGTTSLHAQSQATVDKAASDSRSCLLMSDSLVSALGLSAEQVSLVRRSDERVLQACEKAGYRSTGQVDDAAVREHAFEMRDILTAEQYAVWSDLCVAGKAVTPTPSPGEE